RRAAWRQPARIDRADEGRASPGAVRRPGFRHAGADSGTRGGGDCAPGGDGTAGAVFRPDPVRRGGGSSEEDPRARLTGDVARRRGRLRHIMTPLFKLFYRLYRLVAG